MIAKEIENKISGGSLIRKMFDEGSRLKKIYGDDKVFDFSIGNPDLEPPKEVKDALIELANADIPGMHGYMANAGYPESGQDVLLFIDNILNFPKRAAFLSGSTRSA